MVRGRGTAVGKWEAVVEEPQQQIVHGEHGLPMTAAAPPVAEDNDPNHENFKFRHKDKRPVHDVYDDDEWDSAALGSIKLKSKERKIGHEPEAAAEAGKGNTGWSKIGKAKEEVKEEVKTEGGVEAKEEVKTEDAAPSAFKTEPAVTDSNPVAEVKAEPEAEVAPASGSLFKKRRPPPSSRKK
jgi:hypothetical protein